MFKKDRDDKPLQGCNDCIFDYDGNLWVTAPAGNIAPEEYARSTEVSRECIPGNVLHLITAHCA